jgi:hypothetical protein
MNYLDQAGLGYLWSKIKTHVGTVVEGGVGEIVVNWDDIQDKPSTFTPSTHTHTVSQITDFPTNIVTNVNISGSGNAVTNASFSDNTLTITKGTIEGGGGDSNTVTQMTDDTTSIYWTPLLASYSANNNTETNFVRKLKGVEYNFSEGYFVINETASGIDTMALHIGAVTGDTDLGDGLTINNHGISVSPGGADNSVFRTDGTTSQLKTINNQSIFGTGNINTSYTSSSLSYSAGQFELRLESANTGSLLRDTCPFEYNDLAGIPTFKTVNGQSIIGSGDITIQGGSGGDGNYYPTAFELSNTENQLIGILRMSGTPDKTANGPHFATINGTSIMGASDNNIVINWDNLEGKPSWAESGEITWDDITDPPDIVNDVHVMGDGNAVVDASYDGGILILTKGTISAGTSGITQSEADGRYVNVSGDTMTGDLNVTGHTVNAQTVDVTNVEAL